MTLRILGTTPNRFVPPDSVAPQQTIVAAGSDRLLGVIQGSIAPNVPTAPVETFATKVVDGKQTSYRDTPMFATISVRPYVAAGEVDALRSATANTAIAFGLPVTVSADRALWLQKQDLSRPQDDLRPMQTIELAIVPP